ncbi:MAG: hypothetical protein HC924_14285 [Synechococcaceae cyanobacterium SM2_3_2]|nr:hypothetical protein [Synechococcaceae cyanobacterium SM2_3_2]
MVQSVSQALSSQHGSISIVCRCLQGRGSQWQDPLSGWTKTASAQVAIRHL